MVLAELWVQIYQSQPGRRRRAAVFNWVFKELRESKRKTVSEALRVSLGSNPFKSHSVPDKPNCVRWSGNQQALTSILTEVEAKHPAAVSTFLQPVIQRFFC